MENDGQYRDLTRFPVVQGELVVYAMVRLVGFGSLNARHPREWGIESRTTDYMEEPIFMNKLTNGRRKMKNDAEATVLNTRIGRATL